MSNFIKYEGQKYRINLDLVAKYYLGKFSGHEYQFAICFEHSAMTDDNIQETQWYFATEEERDKVLAVIDKYKTTIIQIEG